MEYIAIIIYCLISIGAVGQIAYDRIDNEDTSKLVVWIAIILSSILFPIIIGSCIVILFDKLVNN